jgi:hypothetical protein
LSSRKAIIVHKVRESRLDANSNRKNETEVPVTKMNAHGTSSPMGAGTPGIPSTPISQLTIDLTSSPVVPSSPVPTSLTITEEEAVLLLTPEGLSRREYNLFKRKRKAALKEAEKLAKADLPERC